MALNHPDPDRSATEAQPGTLIILALPPVKLAWNSKEQETQRTQKSRKYNEGKRAGDTTNTKEQETQRTKKSIRPWNIAKYSPQAR